MEEVLPHPHPHKTYLTKKRFRLFMVVNGFSSLKMGTKLKTETKTKTIRAALGMVFPDMGTMLSLILNHQVCELTYKTLVSIA